MSNFPFEAGRIFVTAPLSVDELEDGLRLLDQGAVEADDFWDANLAAFRQAMLAAIEETSSLLSAKAVPARWRSELEVQVQALRRYVEIVDLCAAGRKATLN